eukprot:GHUV01014384.1.p1 GENE.GHUV01014384.1~~GHUV01014384.1.p1  ORF type:complete len:619 (+),score=130.70 GHUV01014384.1:1438-3294(+)
MSEVCWLGPHISTALQNVLSTVLLLITIQVRLHARTIVCRDTFHETIISSSVSSSDDVANQCKQDCMSHEGNGLYACSSYLCAKGSCCCPAAGGCACRSSTLIFGSISWWELLLAVYFGVMLLCDTSCCHLQVVDMLAAATYLAGALEPWVALIVFITIGSYIPLTIIVTEWRGNFRREMNRTENARSARVTDALLNWETVKYFTNEPLEQQKYGEAIDQYQGAEYRFLSSLNVLNVVQSLIMFLGISCGVLACTAGVSQGVLTVGDTVLFLTLMAQLYGPLNFFGTYYRVIQQYMIDMENLLQLLDTPGKVVDAPNAPDLVLSNGTVEFQDVSFGYEPGLSVLKGVSFKVPGGSTVAFVGATGSGKSTLTRLLFRFFDVSAGNILVDGQDLRAINQSSLRRVIGMVPQDCVLFNDTIRYNIRYGRIAATDAEVEEVADAACIHEPITTRFPKGYDTVVGERGLRLSGGEKQRVAFARALLKNPPLLVLDEATSALDTITEKKIQASLAAKASNRTTFIVAHRLSTISDADLIVVLKEGLVAEMGSHNELLAAGGLYAELWSKQAHREGDAAHQGNAASSSSSRPGSTVDLAQLEQQQNGGNGQQRPAAASSHHRHPH